MRGQTAKAYAFQRKLVQRLVWMKLAAQVGPFAGKNIRGNLVTGKTFREPLLNSALLKSAPGTIRFSIPLQMQVTVTM